MKNLQALVQLSTLLFPLLCVASEVMPPVQTMQPKQQIDEMPDSVRKAFDSARRSSTFAIPRFKRLSYRYKNEVMIPGYPKQKNPTQSSTEVIVEGEVLNETFTPMPNFEVKRSAIFGGLVTIGEPSRGKPCSGSAISQLQVDLPPVLEVGSKLRVQYVLAPTPLDAGCQPTAKIVERCDATSEIRAKTMHAAMTGRAIRLECWTVNRISQGMPTYLVYLEDLGLLMTSTENEHRGRIMRNFTEFVVE